MALTFGWMHLGVMNLLGSLEKLSKRCSGNGGLQRHFQSSATSAVHSDAVTSSAAAGLNTFSARTRTPEAWSYQ
ncbi:MAG: hypothetical protein QOE90_3493 [Thermoplasmata archaeon]|nr:hypothetical protein [Thermoplasmata archaeon]